MRTKKLNFFQLSALRAQLVTALVVIVLIGCGGGDLPPTPTKTTSVAPATPKPTRALPVAVLPNRSRLTLELAVTNEEISQGLMFRNSLPATRAMLFLFSEERVPSFWMKNTLIPLDMVFLSPEGVIVDVIQNARPCSSEPCPQYVPKTRAMAVLEVAAGVAEHQGLHEGVRLYFKRVPGYPREVAQ